MLVVSLTLAAVTVFCAGALTLRGTRVDLPQDSVARLGLILATGVSVIPLLFEIFPFVRWTTTLARLLFACAFVGWLCLSPRRRLIRSLARRPVRWYLVTAAFLIVTTGLAISQVRGAAVAPGVDSVHHIMLTRLITGEGRLPADLEPFIPGGRLTYHWGAHANVAFLALLVGRTSPFEVSQLLVWYGALLRVVCVLAIYAAARMLFADRATALVCGAIATGFSALPAELLTQGRFTHLGGVAILPAMMAVPLGSRRIVSRSMTVGILLAGVFLIQARLVVFGVAWVLVSALFSLRGRTKPALARATFSLVFAAVLVLPWSVRLARDPLVRSMVAGKAFAQEKNRWTQRYVPPKLVWLDNNGLLLSGATAGLSGVAGLGVSPRGRIASLGWACLVALAASLAAGRRRPAGRSARREARRSAGVIGLGSPRRFPWRPLALLLLWTALSAVALVAHSPGVDLTSVVPYAAGTLTSFIPMILMAGGLVAWVAGVLLPARRDSVAAVVLAACTAGGVLRASGQAVRSPVPEADRRAMEWITANIPPSARFAVMARPFYGEFVGEDAGYWIHVLTDRRSLLPPMIYGWVSPVKNVEHTNELLRLWTTVHPDSSVPRLLDEGVTHAYIGSTTHQQARDIMKSCSGLGVIYERDGVMIAVLQRDRL